MQHKWQADKISIAYDSKNTRNVSV